MKSVIVATDFMRQLNNIVKYSDGFITESKRQGPYLANKLAETSIAAFYEYLDSLARVNPGMLHHIYEWDRVGDPGARLVELQKAVGGSTATITSEFMQSSSIKEGSNEPFFDKARIMEDGIPVTIQATNAQAMFFEVDGEEFFRTGPIVIENPGGPETRGSFLEAFEKFYNVYFDQMYLRTIRFYDHFGSMKEYQRNFGKAARSGGAAGIGKAAALKWFADAPGDEYE